MSKKIFEVATTYAFAFIVLVPLFILYYAWALVTLWDWFITPLFGLPELTYPYAMGLSVVASFLNGGSIPTVDSDKSKEQKIYDGVYLFIKPVFAVLVGWVILQFI